MRLTEIQRDRAALENEDTFSPEQGLSDLTDVSYNNCYFEQILISRYRKKTRTSDTCSNLVWYLINLCRYCVMDIFMHEPGKMMFLQ